MTTTTRFNVDQLIEIPAQHVAVLEILKGTFDDEIKRITVLRDELKARQDVDQTLEKASSALADAKSKQDVADKVLADAKFQAQQVSDQASKMMTEAMTSTVNAESAAAKIASDRSVFEADRANTKELHDQRSAALDLRESQLATAAAKIGEDQRKLSVERDAFNKRLDALKA
jgi:electron transfer flavoprotein alpha subunit